MNQAFIEGEKIYLRGLYKEDISSNMFNWTDDRDVTKYLFRGLFPNNIQIAEQQYEQMIKNDKEIELAIINKEDDQLIGITGMHSINWISRSGEFRILIGEKDYWGKGLGKEVTQLMCAYGFNKLNLEKVWLGVTKSNERAYQTYVNCGFVIEGELRNEVFRNGVYYNVTRMSILRNEFKQKKGKWIMNKKIEEQFQG
jgi:RimJ/RimL family protein N-acetyltransferase